MNWDASLGHVNYIENKWELAQRLSGHAKAPEQALKAVFDGAMQGLEGASSTKFESSMKERVWNTISGAKLKILKEAFFLQFCEKVLGGFSDNEAGVMLEEHKRLGVIKNEMHSSKIQFCMYFNQESIINAIVEKANGMTKDLVSEIIVAVKKEGIELPDPK